MRFFQKIRLRQFSSLKAPKLHAKFQKNPMSRFAGKVITDRQTDRQTDRLTDSGNLIGPLLA